jgi:uroporphyrinogen decarboxylase
LYGWVATYFGGPSLYGFCRMLMGEEALAYAFYDEPGMVHDMMETMTEFSIAVLARALREAPVTLVQLWEDMCYRGGPLVSPRMVREFMLPRYRRICDAVRAAGVDIIFLDSDGDLGELIPLWLEAGINGLFPFERAAGNDIVELRRRYGRNLLMSGGIDKRALPRGRAAIDAELDRIIPVALDGGYVPTLDHGIPPDVPWEAFRYYWERKKHLLGIGEVELTDRHFFW